MCVDSCGDVQSDMCKVTALSESDKERQEFDKAALAVGNFGNQSSRSMPHIPSKFLTRTPHRLTETSSEVAK